MSTVTQKKQLLDHLLKYKRITSLEATKKYYILRPSNRMQELKADGYNIQTEIIWKKRRDGKTTHYAKYTLIS